MDRGGFHQLTSFATAPALVPVVGFDLAPPVPEIEKQMIRECPEKGLIRCSKRSQPLFGAFGLRIGQEDTMRNLRTATHSAIRRYVLIDVAAVSMLRCVSITPFGSPVLPEV